MIKALTLLTLVLGAQASFAGANITLKCELMDYSVTSNPTVQRQAYTIPVGQTITVSTYRGLVFEATASKVQTPNFSGYKVGIGARDSTTAAIVGRAYTVFETEMADLTFQDGDNFFLHCISPDRSF